MATIVSIPSKQGSHSYKRQGLKIIYITVSIPSKQGSHSYIKFEEEKASK